MINIIEVNGMDSSKIVASKDEKYKIYQFFNKENIGYYVVVPDRQIDNYNIFVGFDGNLEEVKSIGEEIFNGYDKAIYVVPLINMEEFKTACVSDNRDLFKKILREIQGVTYDVANRIFEAKHHMASFDKVINFVLLNEMDKKFFAWLKATIPNYVNGVWMMINNSKQNFFDSLQEMYGDGSIILSQDIGRRNNDDLIFVNGDKNLVERINNRNESLFDNGNSNNETEEKLKVEGKIKKTVDSEKKSILKERHSSGFGKVLGLILTLIVSLFIGLGIGYLILK